ncbi:hypothetical protein [Stratiformator vulcanicus]|uniref:Lipoprotein n=1 Tax=Stratiformator vulcanicus TaxID=2527980 RepID=A0A517R067_9PLAN|nr:hypothetical protein [Stratiformator vulcanicus]QDT37289.1 hypothetical protein Pan189_16620 [Stratiformator vulcanicus]
MQRPFTAALIGLCALIAVGCQSLSEKRTVRLFAEALSEGDYEALTERSSPRFQSVALPEPDALTHLKSLSLPTGEFEVKEIVDLQDDDWTDPDIPEKIVTVEVGNPPRTMRYRIARSGHGGRWVVDDVFMRRVNEGVTSTRSVTEQMTLLLAVSNFVEEWADKDGGRDTSALAEPLASNFAALPEAQREALAHRMFHGFSKRNLSPEASIDDGVAVVTMTRPGGRVLLSLKRDGNATWLVDEIAFEDRDKKLHLNSLNQAALALDVGNSFFDAYTAADLDGLQSTATDRFFNHCLKSADLSKVSLDEAAAARGRIALDLLDESAELVAQTDGGRVVIALDLVGADDSSTGRKFRVSEVTLFSPNDQEERRLSSALTGDAVMLLFAGALADGDLSLLSQTSTYDFRERVWKYVKPGDLDRLPLDEVRNSAPIVDRVIYRGPVTEYLVMHGGVAATYHLIDQGGAVRVNDVQLAVENRPRSLKQTLEHTLPVIVFCRGVEQDDLNMVRQTCSSEFNRLVWSQMRATPREAKTVAALLKQPLASLEIGSEAVKVKFGDSSSGGAVKLIREGEDFRIDELVAVAGPAAHQQAELKQALKDMIAAGSLQRRTRGDVQTNRQVVPVGYTTSEEMIGLPTQPGIERTAGKVETNRAQH